MARNDESRRRAPRRFYGSRLDGPRRPAPHGDTDGRRALDHEEALNCLGTIHAAARARRKGGLAGEDRKRRRSDRGTVGTSARRDGRHALRPVARRTRPASVARRRAHEPVSPRVELAEPRLHELWRSFQPDPRQFRDQLRGGAGTLLPRAPRSVWLASPWWRARRLCRRPPHAAGDAVRRERDGCDADGRGRGAGRPSDKCGSDGRGGKPEGTR